MACEVIVNGKRKSKDEFIHDLIDHMNLSQEEISKFSNYLKSISYASPINRSTEVLSNSSSRDTTQVVEGVSKPKPESTPAPQEEKQVGDTAKEEVVYRSPEDVDRISAQTLPSHLKDTPVTIKGTDGKPKTMKAKDAYVAVKKVYKLLNSKKFLDCIGRG